MTDTAPRAVDPGPAHDPASDLSARRWASGVLREAGLKVTRPRVLVLLALRGRERPVTAREVCDVLATPAGRETPPGMTTIYRALAVLAERGLLHRFPRDRAVTAYRLCPPARHHHLLCRSCGRVQEQRPGPVPEWVAVLATTEGFAIEDYHAELVGLCARCRVVPLGS